MADVHNLVEEGREGLNAVEGHVDATDKNTSKAVDELVVASKLACGARWKVLIIVLLCLAILLVIAAVIGVVVGVVVGLKK